MDFMGFVVAQMARFGEVATCLTGMGLNKQGSRGCVRSGQDVDNLAYSCHKGRCLKTRGAGVCPRWWQVVGKLTFYLHGLQDFGGLVFYEHGWQDFSDLVPYKHGWQIFG